MICLQSIWAATKATTKQSQHRSRSRLSHRNMLPTRPYGWIVIVNKFVHSALSSLTHWYRKFTDLHCFVVFVSQLWQVKVLFREWVMMVRSHSWEAKNQGCWEHAFAWGCAVDTGHSVLCIRLARHSNDALHESRTLWSERLDRFGSITLHHWTHVQTDSLSSAIW